MQTTHSTRKFSLLYYFLYSGLGVFLPLLALYLENIVGLNGLQIGSISAIGALVGIFSGPVWGYVSDRFSKHKAVLMILMSGVMILSLIIPRIRYYPLLLIAFFFFYMCLSPLNPLLDGITLHSGLPFGSIRLWGSIGFAIAAFFTGRLASSFGLGIIFYLMIGTMFLSLLSLQQIKVRIHSSEGLNLKQVSTLFKNRRFMVFLIYSMLITCTFSGTNTYFGLYFQSMGGDAALVGMAFLLFAISEVPFMQLISKYLKTHKPYLLLAIVPIIGIIRWLYYAMGPSPVMILATFPLQGLFYSPILVGYAEFIRLELPANLRTSGITLFTAVSFGIGGIFINFISGLIYDHFPARMIFFAYAGLCLLSLAFVPYLFTKGGHSKFN